MNKDIRISTLFKNHRKRRRLVRLLGQGAEVYLIDLWLAAALERPTGHLVGWDDDDVADASGWMGSPQKLVGALIESNWLEKDLNGDYVIHDWCEHQPWACAVGDRADKARFSRLAQINRDAYESLKKQGVTAITQAEYNHFTKQVVRPKSLGESPETNGESPNDQGQVAGDSLADGGESSAPSPAPSPAPYANKSVCGNSAKLPPDPLEKFSEETIAFVKDFNTYVKNTFGKTAPQQTPKSFADSCDAVDKLQRIDGFTMDEIRETLQWACSEGNFWRKNAKSLAAIRKVSDPDDRRTKFQKIRGDFEDPVKGALSSRGGRLQGDALLQSNSEQARKFVGGL